MPNNNYPINTNVTPDFMQLVDPRLTGKSFVTPLHSLKADPTIRLIGATFDTATLNTNFWSTSQTGNGTVTISQPAVVVGSGTIAGTTRLQSIKRARFLVNSNNWFVAGVRCSDAGTTGNIRRWGVMDSQNGMFFELNGTVLSCVTRKNGVDTISASNGSFNGSLGPTIKLTLTNFNTFEILWSAGQVLWMLGGGSSALIHRLPASNTAYAATFSLPLSIENINSTNTTDVTVETRAFGVSRVGAATGRPSFKNEIVATTNTLKDSAGTLHRIVVNKKATNSATLTVYDSLTGTGTRICSIELNNTLGTLEYDLDFDNGLTYVTTGTGIDVTFVFD